MKFDHGLPCVNNNNRGRTPFSHDMGDHDKNPIIARSLIDFFLVSFEQIFILVPQTWKFVAHGC